MSTDRGVSRGAAGLLRVLLDLLALLLAGALLWRFLAGTDRLALGGMTLVSMRNLFRPLRALGTVLLLRHLLFGGAGQGGVWATQKGRSGPLDQLIAGVVSPLAGPFRGIAGGVAVWTILAGAGGAARALVGLSTTQHLELTLRLQMTAVAVPALREALWGLLAGVVAALLASGLDRLGAGKDADRSGGRRFHLLCLDLFLIAATFGPWAREGRWELAVRQSPLPGRFLTALFLILLLASAAAVLRTLASARSRPAFLAAVLALPLSGLGAVYAFTPLPQLVFGGPPAWVTGTRAPVRPEAARRILLVTIDTLRADHLGCYGYPHPTSPEIDRLAAEGTLFERAYCPMPLTDPSHASMLTGSYPRSHGILRNGTPIVRPERFDHLPRFLRDRGFATAAITSRQHLHPAALGIDGFDYYSVPVSDEKVPAGDTLARALRWIDTHGKKEFFLWVHFFDPHYPYDPPARFAAPFLPDYRGTIDRGNNYSGSLYADEEVPYLVGLYDGEIAYADDAVGSLVRAVRRAASDGPAPLILITADHGESLAELKDTHDYVFGHGEYLVETQVRVPLIVVQEGRVAAGRVVSGVVETISVAPTIAASLGADGAGYSTQAPSLWSMASRGDRGPPEGAAVDAVPEGGAAFLQRRYFEQPPRPYHEAEESGIVTARWKLIENPLRGTELFDLEADPAETDNRAEERESIVLELSDRLEGWKELHRIPTEAFEGIPPEKIEQLRGLGYVQ